MKADGLNLIHEFGRGFRLVLDVSGDDVDVARTISDQFRGKPVSIDVKAWHPKRSLSANAYAWVLIGKIAEKQKLTKSEVYRSAIREIGGVSDTVCVVDKAVDRLRKNWSEKGLGWFTDVVDSKLAGCTNVTLYYGSSVYDTAQMSALIDGLVQECRQLGIEHLPPQELKAMLARWGDAQTH